VILTGTEFENGSQGGRGVNGLARSHEAKHDSKYQTLKQSGRQQVSFEGQGPKKDHEYKVRILEGHTGENIKNGLYISRKEK